MPSTTIAADQSGQRLDVWLTATTASQSRTYWQKQVVTGAVLVNEKPVSKHYALRDGDVVRWSTPDQTPGVLAPLPIIPIIHEDEALLVLNKPTDVVMHATSSSDLQASVARWVVEHDAGIATVGENPLRPGIIHRLDKLVSGVVVIAKTNAAFAALKDQFMNRTVHKAYRAIVHGVPIEPVGTIDFPLERSTKQSGKMAARSLESGRGRSAHTEYTVIQTLNNRFTELSVVIKTGRMHQIRAHLSAIGHPVVGDLLYVTKPYRKSGPYPRLFLHAHTIGIIHPLTGESVEYTAPVPEVFGDFMGK